MQGKIIKGIAGFYYVHVAESGIYECKAKGAFRNQKVKPLVGDNIRLDVLDEEEKKGNIEEKMMYNTFNMGLGMVLAVAPEDVDKTMEAIRKEGDTPYVVGRIEAGEKGVTLC